MLLALSCASAQLVALVVWLLARAAGVPPNRPNALLLVVSTLLGVAILTGLAILVFTPIVYRVRKSRPPTLITVAALIIALAPMLTLVVLGFLTADSDL